MILPNVLKHNLPLVIVGTGAGGMSGEVKNYYADPRNRFWKVLHSVRLTPSRVAPTDYRHVLRYGIGLTDLVKNKAGSDKKLTNADYMAGRQVLYNELVKYQPYLVCFNGLTAPHKFFRNDTIDYGLIDFELNETRFFVAPSTSGAANKHWNVTYWDDVARLVREVRGG